MILDDTSTPARGEERLAALTAANRTEWAETRQKHFFRGTNRISLDAIEKAAFVVALDDVPYEYSEVSASSWRTKILDSLQANLYLILACYQNDSSKLDQYGRILLHGNGCNRWFDKSFTLCVGTNGRVSVECIFKYKNRELLRE